MKKPSMSRIRAFVAKTQASNRSPSSIPGGNASGMHPRDFDADALARGIADELEHTTSMAIAMEIAMDHITKNRHYYDKKTSPAMRSSEAQFRAIMADAKRRTDAMGERGKAMFQKFLDTLNEVMNREQLTGAEAAERARAAIFGRVSQARARRKCNCKRIVLGRML